MKTKIVTTLILLGLAVPVQAQNSVVHQLENQSCPMCNQIIADADARQQRQQDRQQRLEQHQERLEQRQQERQQRQQDRQERLQQNQERMEQREQERQERLQSGQNSQPQRQNNQRHPERDDYWQDEYWRQPYQDFWWDQNPGQYNYPRTTVEDSSETPPVGKQIKVDLISQTQDKVTVLIEGENNQRVIVFNENNTKQTVYLAPGDYKLWFNNALGKSWTSITLKLVEINPVRVTFQKDNPLIQVNNSCTSNSVRDCSK